MRSRSGYQRRCQRNQRRHWRNGSLIRQSAGHASCTMPKEFCWDAAAIALINRPRVGSRTGRGQHPAAPVRLRFAGGGHIFSGDHASPRYPEIGRWNLAGPTKGSERTRTIRGYRGSEKDFGYPASERGIRAFAFWPRQDELARPRRRGNRHRTPESACIRTTAVVGWIT
jgi:hypothetical protein